MEKFLVQNYKSIIKECFESDEELINKWHIVAGAGLDACVSKTHDDLVKADLNFFVLKEDENIAGFFGVEHVGEVVALTGFFVKPQYRNKEHLDRFWTLVNQEINGPFICGIFSKNKRAEKFLMKNNGKLIASLTYGDDGALIYGFNMENVCL